MRGPRRRRTPAGRLARRNRARRVSKDKAAGFDGARGLAYNPTNRMPGGKRETRRTQRRNELVCRHVQLAGRIARELIPRLPAHFEFDDLESAGRLGLLRAAERYRPRAHGGAPFEAFARPWVRGAILSAVRREWSAGEGRHGFKPVTEGLPAGEDWGAAFDERGALEDAIDGARRAQTITAAVETLSDEEKGLLRAVYSTGARTVRAAAAELGISAGRAYRLHNSGIEALRSRLVP